MEGSVFVEMMGIVNMMIGMVAGMVASPFMMKGIKQWQTHRKVCRMLQEIAESRRSNTASYTQIGEQ